jgi:YfiH family protein
VSAPVFMHCAALSEMGVEHGLGTRASSQVLVPGLTLAAQVHGTRLLRAPLKHPGEQADALYTTEPDLAVGVRTADCVPILLADPDARAVAAIHAGWRGSAARIAERTLAGLERELGVEPEAWIAVVGPHIGPCCYEVDEPVREAVAEPCVFAPSDRPGHYDLDLFELNRLQLLRGGVAAERIHRVGGCTSCHPALYQSYRREGTAGRMLHYVRMPRA